MDKQTTKQVNSLTKQILRLELQEVRQQNQLATFARSAKWLGGAGSRSLATKGLALDALGKTKNALIARRAELIANAGE